MTQKLSKVLIVDDEPQIRRFLRASLTAHNYDICEAGDAGSAIKAATIEQPDLMILDLGLPDMDGLELISRMREWSTVPIIVLSIRADESDKIDALDRGADDYVTKPFGMGELLARVRAALRDARAGGPADETPVFRSGELMVDLTARRVQVGGREIKLSRKEYELLRVLITHAGKVLTHQQLLKEIWGEAHVDDTQYLRVYIRQVRNKIEPDPARPAYILTEQGVGYRLSDPDGMGLGTGADQQPDA